MNFTKPKTQKELKRFVGIATYFSSHIRNYSNLTKPLRDMMTDYKPKSKLQWNELTDETFIKVKDAINNCPTLYFVRSDLPVYLHTDASDTSELIYFGHMVQLNFQWHLIVNN